MLPALGVLQLHEAGRGFLTQCGLQCQNNEKRRQNDIFLCMIFFFAEIIIVYYYCSSRIVTNYSKYEK